MDISIFKIYYKGSHNKDFGILFSINLNGIIVEISTKKTFLLYTS